MFIPFALGVSGVLGSFRPPAKELKTLSVHHRPEATGSGSYRRIMFEWHDRLSIFRASNSIALRTPRVSRLPSVTMVI